ncbi:hypothetical protein GCM10020220_022690 [Nonomuraea rubra]
MRTVAGREWRPDKVVFHSFSAGREMAKNVRRKCRHIMSVSGLWIRTELPSTPAEAATESPCPHAAHAASADPDAHYLPHGRRTTRGQRPTFSLLTTLPPNTLTTALMPEPG